MKDWLIRICVLAVILAGAWWGYGFIQSRQREASLKHQLGVAVPQGMQADERRKAALLTKGPFATDIDPRVNFRLKPNWESTFIEAKATTDSFGMRVRSGPPPTPRAQRVVILGDSVAFGLGVKDDEVIAHQLELVLASACDAQTAPPVVFTVACGGWNFKNAERFLRNHAFRLKPDVVVWIPVANDLDDGYLITESGHRIRSVDLTQGADALPISIETFWRFAALAQKRLSKDRFAALAKAGLRAITEAHRNGITPLSKARFAELIGGLIELHKDLKANDAQFAMCHFWDNDFDQDLEHRVLGQDPDFPIIRLFTDQHVEDTLVIDGHPNATSLRGAAITLAHELIARGWITGINAEKLPPIPSKFASRRMPKRNQAERAAKASADQALMKAWMNSFIDLSLGEGCHQIYAGIDIDGRVGRMCSFSLAQPMKATHLELKLALVDDASFLYPCELEVSFNGVPAPVASLPRPGESGQQRTLKIAIPSDCATQPILDIQIRPSNYVGQWVDESKKSEFKLTSFFFESARIQ